MASTPRFKAINTVKHPQTSLASAGRRSPASSSSSEEFPSPSTLMKRACNARRDNENQEEEPRDIRDRDWPIEKVIKKRTRLGQTEYRIQWVPSILDQKDIRTRPDKTKCVRCAGEDWKILDEIAAPAPRSGKPRCEFGGRTRGGHRSTFRTHGNSYRSTKTARRAKRSQPIIIVPVGQAVHFTCQYGPS